MGIGGFELGGQTEVIDLPWFVEGWLALGRPGVRGVLESGGLIFVAAC